MEKEVEALTPIIEHSFGSNMELIETVTSWVEEVPDLPDIEGKVMAAASQEAPQRKRKVTTRPCQCPPEEKESIRRYFLTGRW